MEEIVQKDDQRERMSKASKDMSDHTRREDKSQRRNKEQSRSTKGGIMRGSKMNLSDILREEESPEEEHETPQLLCLVSQCRHWTPFDDPNAVSGRCALEHTTIYQKTGTICDDGVTRYTAQWPEFVCDGFEWHDQYDRQNATWLAVAEVRAWPEGPDIDREAIDRLVRAFRFVRGKRLEDPTDE
jgi:hypothetical protein